MIMKFAQFLLLAPSACAFLPQGTGRDTTTRLYQDSRLTVTEGQVDVARALDVGLFLEDIHQQAQELTDLTDSLKQKTDEVSSKLSIEDETDQNEVVQEAETPLPKPSPVFKQPLQTFQDPMVDEPGGAFDMRRFDFLKDRAAKLSIKYQIPTLDEEEAKPRPPTVLKPPSTSHDPLADLPGGAFDMRRFDFLKDRATKIHTKYHITSSDLKQEHFSMAVEPSRPVPKTQFPHDPLADLPGGAFDMRRFDFLKDRADKLVAKYQLEKSK